MVLKDISITEKQGQWIKAQIEAGVFESEDELVRELIKERQLTSKESKATIEAISKELRIGEKSGISASSEDDIWSRIEARRQAADNA